MTVNPGFSEQSFLASMLPEIRTVRDRIDRSSYPISLAVDGGVDEQTSTDLLQTGTDVLVSGTEIFKHPPYH